MTYKEKLQQFNSTDKYRMEMGFMHDLMGIKHGEMVLDFGCGSGFMCKWMGQNTEGQVFGYDIDFGNLLQEDSHRFRKAFHFTFDKIYMMHSLAHVKEPFYELRHLKQFIKPGGMVYVLTPNDQFLKALPHNPEYIPDPTVVVHFQAAELESLFTESGYKVIYSGGMGKVQEVYYERLFLVAKC